MRNRNGCLKLSLGILVVPFFLGCQSTYPKTELVQIKDIDYNPETKITLVTVKHQGGCKNQNYNYEYQELNSNTKNKTLIYGLFVDIQSKCQKQDLQFIRIPLPQTSFPPDQLIFQSSDNKRIIFTIPTSQTKKTAPIKLEPYQKISILEDANFNQFDHRIALTVFVPDGCGGQYTHKYQIIEQNSMEKSVSLALITEVKETCIYGDYITVKTPLPQLSFQPQQLIFPISEAKKIILTIPY